MTSMTSVSDTYAESQLLSTISNPLNRFKFALKAKESKRHYPRRLKVFFDFLNLQTTVLEEQALLFYRKAKQDTEWVEEVLILFAEHQKTRVEKVEIL